MVQVKIIFSLSLSLQDLGCIQTTILFQPWENRISATVEQAKGLRPNRITGTVGKWLFPMLSITVCCEKLCKTSCFVLTENYIVSNFRCLFFICYYLKKYFKNDLSIYRSCLFWFCFAELKNQCRKILGFIFNSSLWNSNCGHLKNISA